MLKLRTVALGLALTALASPAAGQGRVAIDFWTNGTSAEQAFFETLIAEFERQNPTIDVRVQAIATPQYLNAVQLAYRSGNEPDVLRAQGNFFNVQLPLPKWVEQGWLLPLDRFVTSSVLARFPAGAVNDSLTRVNGRLYSLPMQRRGTSALLALVYNKRLYAAAGLTTPPRSWDEMRTHARRVAAAGGGRTFGLGIEPGNPRANFLAARGGFVGDHRSALDFRTGRYNASDPAMVAAVNLMRTMNLEDRSVVPGWEANYDIPASFARGQIGMFLAQPSQVANLLADFKMSPADFGLAVVPGPAGRAALGLPYEPALGFLGITAKTPHPAEAWRLMDFLYSDRTALTVLRANQGQLGGFIPSVKIARNELTEINPTAAAMNAVYDQEGVNRPDPLLRNPAWAQVVANFVAPQPGLVDIQKAAIQGQADYATLARQYDTANNAALDAAIAAAQKEGAKVCRELLVFRNFNGTKNYTTRDYAGLPGCN